MYFLFVNQKSNGRSIIKQLSTGPGTGYGGRRSYLTSVLAAALISTCWFDGSLRFAHGPSWNNLFRPLFPGYATSCADGPKVTRRNCIIRIKVIQIVQTTDLDANLVDIWHIEQTLLEAWYHCEVGLFSLARMNNSFRSAVIKTQSESERVQAEDQPLQLVEYEPLFTPNYFNKDNLFVLIDGRG